MCACVHVSEGVDTRTDALCPVPTTVGTRAESVPSRQVSRSTRDADRLIHGMKWRLSFPPGQTPDQTPAKPSSEHDQVSSQGYSGSGGCLVGL